MRCINCGRLGTVTRTGDNFACATCDYEWDVAHEQANAVYLDAQGRKPAQSIKDMTAVPEPDAPVDEVAEILAPVEEPMPDIAPVFEEIAIDATRDAGPLSDDERHWLVTSLRTRTVAELDEYGEEAGIPFNNDDLKADKIDKLADSGRVDVTDGAIIVIPIED